MAKTDLTPNLPPDEQLVAIPEAFERLTGRRPAPATCGRWWKKGIRGVKLRTTLFGGRRLCAIADAREFLDATTRAADAECPTAQPRTNRQREAAIKRAESDLSEAGA